MTEQPEISLEPDRAFLQHILDDLHELRHALAAGLDVLGGVHATTEDTAARVRQLEEEFGPIARKYSRLFGGGPVTEYLAARKAANDGERVHGGAEGNPGPRRPRFARRQLPHGRLRGRPPRH
jgi:hypothetical protein